MKKSLMISCRDATELSIKKNLEKLSFYDKLRLWFHTSMCRFCSLFEKQNKIIDEMSARLDEAAPAHMPESAKQKIIEEVLH